MRLCCHGVLVVGAYESLLVGSSTTSGMTGAASVGPIGPSGCGICCWACNSAACHPCGGICTVGSACGSLPIGAYFSAALGSGGDRATGLLGASAAACFFLSRSANSVCHFDVFAIR